MAMTFTGGWWPMNKPLQDIGASAMAAQMPQYFPGQTVAGMNPWNLQGMQSLVNAAGQQGQMLGAGGNAWQQALSVNPYEEVDPTQNKVVQKMLNKNRRVANRNLQRDVLPALTHGSVSTGTGMANSADALAKGVAAGDTQEAIVNANADTLMQAQNAMSNRALSNWQTQMAGRNSALGMMPSMMNAATMPGQTVSNVGDYMRQYDQSLINAAKQRWDFGQNSPWQQIQRQLGVIHPIANLGQTSQLPNPDRGGSTLGQILGGGLALGGAFLGGPGGAALGAGLSGMFSNGGYSGGGFGPPGGGYGPWGTGGF